jgi:hypothetical protein
MVNKTYTQKECCGQTSLPWARKKYQLDFQENFIITILGDHSMSSSTTTNTTRMSVVIILHEYHTQSISPRWLAVPRCHDPYWLHELLTVGVAKYIIVCPKFQANSYTKSASEFLSHLQNQQVMILANTWALAQESRVSSFKLHRLVRVSFSLCTCKQLCLQQ